MAISRMQQPRQMYGLGSLVKKAVRGVKKIIKSPLGKAAIIGGLGMIPFGTSKANLFSRLGGALRGGSGLGFLRSGAAGGASLNTGFLPTLKKFGMSMIPGTPGFSGRNLALGLGATAVATPFIQKAMGVGPYEVIEEEEVDEFIDPYTALMMARQRDPYMNFLPNPNYVQEGFYQPAAKGGRIGYASGMRVEDEEDELSLGIPTLMRRGYQQGELVEEASMTEEMQLPPEAEKFLRQEYKKYVAQGGDLSYPEFKMMVLQQAAGEQGPEQEEIMTTEAETIQTEPQMPMMMAGGGLTSVPGYGTPPGTNKFNYPSGGVRVKAEEGGLMDLGGMEKDYRAEGGFVAIGKKEKADDVPARLSVNEFVFTADAVRNAGGGDIDKGAEVMENLMKNLEAGGKVSEDSQGAQAMYDNMKQLETRVV